MSGVMNSPESLPRRRLHDQLEEDTDGERLQEASVIEQSHDFDQPNSDEKRKNGGPSISPLPRSSDEPANPIAWLAPLFHLSMVVFYALLFYYGNLVMSENIKIIDPTGRIPSFGGRFKFLTHINQWVQLFYFSIQFVTDVVPKSPFRRVATKCSDIFFSTIAFPLAWFVVLTFWAIYAYDRQLVYPEAFDKAVPQWLNHFWHTTVGVFILFEMLLVFHRYPRNGLAASIVFAYDIVYIAWIGLIYGQTKFWVYPIIAVLPPPFLLLFFASSIFFTFGLFVAGKFISSLRWGQSSPY